MQGCLYEAQEFFLYSRTPMNLEIKTALERVVSAAEEALRLTEGQRPESPLHERYAAALKTLSSACHHARIAWDGNPESAKRIAKARLAALELPVQKLTKAPGRGR